MSDAFLFGKLPGHGDFVSRGLTTDDRDALDRWLAGSLARAREVVGVCFEEVFDQAPPWRFVWADGERWTAGAMAASVDSVGRRFPILLGRRALLTQWVEDCARLLEDLLYDALTEGWDADRLMVAAADAAALEDNSPTGPGERWWTLGGERFTEATVIGARPAELLTAMLSMGLEDA